MTTNELCEFRSKVLALPSAGPFTVVSNDVIYLMAEALNEHINLRIHFEKKENRT